MAKRKYRPYRSRKQRSRRQMRTLALALVIVLFVGMVFWVKTSGNENTPEQANGEDTAHRDTLSGADNDTTERQSDPPETAFNPGTTNPEDPEKAEEVESAESPAGIAKTGQDSTPVEEPEPILETVRQIPDVQTPLVDSGTTSPEAQELIDKANELRGNGKIIAARDLLNHTLDLKLSAVVRAAVKERMAKLADVWLFSPTVYESDKLTEYYLVQPNEVLSVIARRYKVPYEALMRINNIEDPRRLKAGEKIKIVRGPFNAVIYKSSFSMDLYLQNVYVKTYRVGLGQVQHETPTGLWRVKPGGKLIRPPWTDPDDRSKVYVSSAPDYPLGARWIGIEGMDENTKDLTGFAMHGTKDPESIGTRASRGCIRLQNDDVIELYNMLQEGISEVWIKD